VKWQLLVNHSRMQEVVSLGSKGAGLEAVGFVRDEEKPDLNRMKL